MDKAKFLADLELAERYWREDGETDAGIEEIKQACRDDWKDAEMRGLWINWIAEIADFMRELQGMARGISDRIKSEMKLKEAA